MRPKMVDTKCRRPGGRLELPQFRFLPDGSGLKVCLPGKTTALARLVPDENRVGMWRVVRRDGSLSDMINKARAKDIALASPRRRSTSARCRNLNPLKMGTSLRAQPRLCVKRG